MEGAGGSRGQGGRRGGLGLVVPKQCPTLGIQGERYLGENIRRNYLAAKR